VGRDVVPLLARLADNATGAPTDPSAARALAAALVAGPEGCAIIPPAAALWPPTTLRLLFEEALRRVRGTVPTAAEQRRLESCIRKGSGAELRGVVVRIRRDGAWDVCAAGAAAPRTSRPTVAAVSVLATVHPAGNEVFLARLRAPQGTAELFDAAHVVLPVAVGPPRPGERIDALGVVGRPQRLSHYLQRRGVPAGDRGSVAVVRDAGDRVLWVVGHGIAKRAAVTPATRSIVLLRMSDVQMSDRRSARSRARPRPASRGC
jgi:hypothetical protein